MLAHRLQRWSNAWPSLTHQPSTYVIGISTHLKLCLADAIHNFKWVKIIDKMEVNDLEILLIDFTFHLKYVQKLVFFVMLKNEKKRM